MVDISIVTMVYKQTNNWGAPPCNHYIIMFISIKTRIHHRQGLITGVLMLMDNHMTVINIPRVAIVMSIDTTGWGPQLCSLVYKP